MKTIPAAKFKAQCLTLMENVRKTRQSVVITKRGKPIAQLAPLDDVKDDFIGRLDGQFEIVEDLDSIPPEEWESAL